MSRFFKKNICDVPSPKKEGCARLAKLSSLICLYLIWWYRPWLGSTWYSVEQSGSALLVQVSDDLSYLMPNLRGKCLVLHSSRYSNAHLDIFSQHLTWTHTHAPKSVFLACDQLSPSVCFMFLEIMYPQSLKEPTDQSGQWHLVFYGCSALLQKKVSLLHIMARETKVINFEVVRTSHFPLLICMN